MVARNHKEEEWGQAENSNFKSHNLSSGLKDEVSVYQVNIQREASWAEGANTPDHRALEDMEEIFPEKLEILETFLWQGRDYQKYRVTT